MFFNFGWWILLNVSPIRSNSSPPEQYSRKRYIVGPSFRCPKKRTMLAWLSIYWSKAHTQIYSLLLQSATLKPVFLLISDVKLPYLVNADLFLDIVSTILCLRSVNHFNRYSFLCMSVHQQPDPGTKAKPKMENNTAQPPWCEFGRSRFILVSRWCWNVSIYRFKQSLIKSDISSLNPVILKMSILHCLWNAFHIINIIKQ